MLLAPGKDTLLYAGCLRVLLANHHESMYKKGNTDEESLLS